MTTKITYFITSLNFGGAEIGMTRLIDGIYRSDQADEIEITVISLVETSRDVVELLPESVEVHHLDIGSPLAIWKTRLLCSALADTDVLVCSLYHASVLGVVAGKIRNVPQILTWQHNSKYRSKTAHALYSLCYRLSDQVLADSEAVRQMLISERDVPASKISVLPIVGVDTDQFRPYEDTIEFDNDQDIQIGTVGRLVRQKGYDYLLECAKQLEDEAHFHVIGNGVLESEIRTETIRVGIDNVTLHGKVPYESLPQYLSSFDIYFQPSRYEGLCMTVIEAMATGLPIVASETGGIRESVLNGETGYLVSPGSIEEYVIKIRSLIEEPKNTIRFGENGRKRVIERYSREEFTRSFLKIVLY